MPLKLSLIVDYFNNYKIYCEKKKVTYMIMIDI